MAIDSKYGRVTIERGNIGEDEPVVVFRAQDRLLPKLLKIYKIFCELAGSPQHHLDIIHDSAMVIKRWQFSNPPRTPNSDAFVERVGGRYDPQFPNNVNVAIHDKYGPKEN